MQASQKNYNQATSARYRGGGPKLKIAPSKLQISYQLK